MSVVHFGLPGARYENEVFPFRSEDELTVQDIQAAPPSKLRTIMSFMKDFFGSVDDVKSVKKFTKLISMKTNASTTASFADNVSEVNRILHLVCGENSFRHDNFEGRRILEELAELRKLRLPKTVKAIDPNGPAKLSALLAATQLMGTRYRTADDDIPGYCAAVAKTKEMADGIDCDTVHNNTGKKVSCYNAKNYADAMWKVSRPKCESVVPVGDAELDTVQEIVKNTLYRGTTSDAELKRSSGIGGGGGSWGMFEKYMSALRTMAADYAVPKAGTSSGSRMTKWSFVLEIDMSRMRRLGTFTTGDHLRTATIDHRNFAIMLYEHHLNEDRLKLVKDAFGADTYEGLIQAAVDTARAKTGTHLQQLIISLVFLGEIRWTPLQSTTQDDYLSCVRNIRFLGPHYYGKSEEAKDQNQEYMSYYVNTRTFSRSAPARPHDDSYRAQLQGIVDAFHAGASA